MPSVYLTDASPEFAENGHWRCIQSIPAAQAYIDGNDEMKRSAVELI